MKFRNKLRIYYDTPDNTGGGSQQATDTTGNQGQANTGNDNGANADNPNPNPTNTDTDNPNPNPTDTNATNTDSGFNPDDMDFGEDNQGEDDYSFLTEQGIDINSESFKGTVSKLNSLGVTDPTVVGNIIKEINESNKPLTAEKIKENLNKGLSSEEKANYKSITQIVKNSLKDEKFKGYSDTILSDPNLVSAINSIIKTARGGINPNPSTSSVPNQNTGLNYQVAEERYRDGISKIIKEHGYIRVDAKERLVRELASQMNPSDSKKFKFDFNVE